MDASSASGALAGIALCDARAGRGEAAAARLGELPESLRGPAAEEAADAAIRSGAFDAAASIAGAADRALRTEIERDVAWAEMRAGDVDRAEAAVARLPDQDRAVALPSLARALAAAGRRDAALAVLEEARNLVRTSAKEAGSSVELRAEDAARAFASLGAFDEAAEMAQLVGPDYIAQLRLFIAGEQVRAGDFAGAERTGGEDASVMIRAARIGRGDDPPSTADRDPPKERFGILALAAETARASGDAALGRELLRRARDAAAGVRGWERGADLYQLAQAQAEAGFGRDARETADLMKPRKSWIPLDFGFSAAQEKRGRAHLLSVVGAALMKEGDVEGARAAFAEAEPLGLVPDPAGSDGRIPVVEHMAEAGLVEEALAAAHRLPPEEQDWALEDVAAGFAAAGRGEEGLAVADTIGRAYARVSAYLAVAGDWPPS